MYCSYVVFVSLQNGWNLDGSEIKELFCNKGSPVSLNQILTAPNNQSLVCVYSAIKLLLTIEYRIQFAANFEETTLTRS